ncbi:MAG: peptidoglycan binding domain-containing protein [Firmicutes bacterium]|nr:peptidoglycan binding domain-containing protein [Bacillota bacterium]
MATISKNVILSKKKALITVSVIALLLIVIAVVAYVDLTLYFKDHFFFGTEINGINCSGQSTENIKDYIRNEVSQYRLTINERDNSKEIITSKDIELKPVFDDSFDKIISSQETEFWLFRSFSDNSYNVDTMMNYDEELFDKKINSLGCFDEKKVIAPEDAKIEYDDKQEKFVIKEEVLGNTLDKEKFVQEIKNSIDNFHTDINAEEYYLAPTHYADEEKIIAACEEMNRYNDVTIEYDMGPNEEVLDTQLLHEWICVSDDFDVFLDGAKMREYTGELASKYNTMGAARQFKTAYGYTVTVSGGDYGRWINADGEVNSLEMAIKAGEDCKKEPVYYQKPVGWGDNEIGNTYAEVDLSNQKMFFTQNGQVVLESDVVTGNPTNGHATPPGTYSVTYKERNATLKGENYETKVAYWMPFNYDIGFHDATWQSAFGGRRYLTYGSHGCVNLPLGVAAQLYDLIERSMPVVCYNINKDDYTTTTTEEATTETTTEKKEQQSVSANSNTDQPVNVTPPPNENVQPPQSEPQTGALPEIKEEVEESVVIVPERRSEPMNSPGEEQNVNQ